MKVSVIIPTYNEEEVVSECIESLSRQSFKDFEIIAVDDGSTDRTLTILQKFQIPLGAGPEANSKFQVIKQKHGGAGAARNLGAKRAKGEILVFVDADMTFDKDFLKKLIKPIVGEKVVGSFSKEEYLLNKENVWAKCWNINRGLPSDRMLPSNYPNKQRVFRAIKKKAFELAGGFEEKAGYNDDWTLSEKLGEMAINAPGAIFYHKNPAVLGEVFIQSRWVAKRKYKLRVVGSVAALARSSFPVSIAVGFIKSIQFGIPEFFVFKLTYDLAAFIGIVEHQFFGKVAK